MLNPVADLLITVLHLYNIVLISALIMSWLISFGIVNRYQPVVQKINYALFRMTDPLLKPIRKYMPDLGSIDISPIVLILALGFLERTIIYYSLPPIMRH